MIRISHLLSNFLTIIYDKGVAGVTFAATNSMFSSHGKRHCSKSERISGRAVWKRCVISIERKSGTHMKSEVKALTSSTFKVLTSGKCVNSYWHASFVNCIASKYFAYKYIEFNIEFCKMSFRGNFNVYNIKKCLWCGNLPIFWR